MYDEDPVHTAFDGGVEDDGAIHSDEESMVDVQYAQEVSWCFACPCCWDIKLNPQAMFEQDVYTTSTDTVHMDLNGDVEDGGAIQGNEEIVANIQHVQEVSWSVFP